ncbi:protoporphyrinogen oxidase [Nocardioides pocheonensis]|uniref:protoporphyrinogen oxidase n=1 Tax=Nocardioides pocheonensis TaxID=661485 RepID=UPI001FE7675A|nr:protoporphyrinogen oxidase [Nocardioides pocheonensis]
MEKTERPTVAVVGGGIAGLAAAARVRAERPDVDVVLLESSPDIGGKLRLGEVGGVVVDVGAEAMLNRRPEAVELTQASGLGDAIVHPATTAANLWSRGELLPMPRTLMGIPTDLKGLADSKVISKAGLARAAMDAVLPASSLDGRDASIGGLVEERFGKEVVDRLVEPLLGGVYAGHAREISARAAVPQVVALLDRDRSLTKAAARAMSGPASDTPIFAGITGGVGRLPAAVVTSSGTRVETDATVRDLARRSEGGWTLVVGSTREPRLVQADAVVLAVPAPPAARLLSDVAPAAALELARIEYASVAVVTLAFRLRDFPEVAGSGFLVPPVDKRAVKAATFSFAKWDWVRDAGGGELLLMRCSLGRHREEHQLQRPDEELVEVALHDLADAIGLSVRPVDAHVQRWGGGLPQYAVGHLQRVAAIRADVARQPGLAVCGAAYDGVGIPACIASGRRAADEVLAALAAPAPER